MPREREYIEQVLVGLLPTQLRRLDSLRISLGITRSAMIREAVDDWLSQHGPESSRRRNVE